MRFPPILRRRWNRLGVAASVLTFCTFFLISQNSLQHETSLDQKYPLLWQHVHMANATGGAWYLPPQWLRSSNSIPTNILDAARLAFQYTNTTSDHNIAHSSIPLIIHQQWGNTDISNWPDGIRLGVEKWLASAVSEGMAYFLWTDDTIAKFMEEYEPAFVEHYRALARKVERSDVFRILVIKWIGGIYGDIDTHLLRPPSSWIASSDLDTWVDSAAGSVHDYTGDVGAIFGIEADCPPHTDAYWRSGYHYPVQLTQWALAARPGHPVLSRFLDDVSGHLEEVSSRNHGHLHSPQATQELMAIDPLTLTGPAAITATVKEWLEEKAGLDWNSLSGLQDGGRSKRVDDILILPITGFSPGRGWPGNMGSKPVTDASARLQHQAIGTWKSFKPTVEYGKLCRTLFGFCREWPRV